MDHLHGTHDWAIVVLSVLTVVAASYTAFDLAGRSVSSGKSYADNAWLAAAACVMGGGIWSMHFIAMLAFHIPGFTIGYDPYLTALSLALSILVTGGAFVVMRWFGPRKSVMLPIGVFMGLGIVIMHYVGMEAMRLPATLVHDFRWLTIVAVFAIVASVAGLWLSFRHVSIMFKVIGAMVMGAATSGMHYAGMMGLKLVPIETPGVTEAVLERQYLVVAVASMTFAILATALVASIADRRMSAVVRKEADALRASEARFRYLYRMAPMPLYTLGPEGIIEDVSDRWLDLMGYARDEVIGRPIFDFFPVAIREMSETEQWPRILSGKNVDEMDYRMVARDGREIDVLITSRVQMDASGGFSSVMCAVVDVTARKSAEQALLQAQKIEAVGRLTGGVAHDFNNLLAVVCGNLGLLKKHLELEGKEKTWLDNAAEAARKGVSLTQRMLSFARRQELVKEAVDLHDLVTGMGELIRRAIGPRHEVRVMVPQGLPKAKADINQTELALLNLCINARDAMPSGGTIVIEGREEGEFLYLSVIDTGIGMDGATLAKATEPFFTTKKVGEGTGLGLPMVMGLAEQSGGKLALSSRPGEGTVAQIWLRKHNGERSRQVGTRHLVMGASDRLRVLVVDDDLLVGASTVDMLEDKGHSAVFASSGEEALRLLRGDETFDVLVSDLTMPGMTGMQLVSDIAKRWPRLPIVLATGYSEHTVPPELAWKLAKPFSQEKLVETVYGAVAEKRKSSIT